MKIAVFLIVSVTLGGLIGIYLLAEPGYLLIRLGSVAIETTLVAAAVALVFLGYGIWLLKDVFALIYRSSKSLTGLPERHRQRQAERAADSIIAGMALKESALIRSGLVSISQGKQLDSPEAVLAAAAQHTLLDLQDDQQYEKGLFLGKSRKASKIDTDKTADQILQKNPKHSPVAGSTNGWIALLRANEALQAGDAAQALAHLSRCPDDVKRHAVFYASVAQCYAKQAAWTKLQDALAKWIKLDPLAKQSDRYRALRTAQLVGQTLPDENLVAIWKALSKSERHDIVLVQGIAEALVLHQRFGMASTLLVDALRAQFNLALFCDYAKLPEVSSPREKYNEALKIVPAKGRAESSVQSVLGQLALAAGDYETARRHFEDALQQATSNASDATDLRANPSAEQASVMADLATIYQGLGKVSIELGDPHRASQYFLRSLDP